MVMRKNNIEQQGTLRRNWVYEHTMYCVIDFIFLKSRDIYMPTYPKKRAIDSPSNNSSNVKFGGLMTLSIGLTNKSVDEGSQEPGITQKQLKHQKAHPSMADDF